MAMLSHAHGYRSRFASALLVFFVLCSLVVRPRNSALQTLAQARHGQDIRLASAAFAALGGGRRGISSVARAASASDAEERVLVLDGGAVMKVQSIDLEIVLYALGCELWVAGDELIIAADSLTKGELGGPHWRRRSLPESGDSPPPGVTTSHLPTVLGSSGEAMQNAADALVEARWNDAWRELEAASGTCREYLPAEDFDALVDLVFACAENVPLVDMVAAPASLERLAAGLELARDRIDQHEDIRMPHKEQASLLVENAAAALRDARLLFDPGTFYLPEDPRGRWANEEIDYDPDDYEDYDVDCEEPHDGDDSADDADGQSHSGRSQGPARDEASATSQGTGSWADIRIREFKEELEKAGADDPDSRRPFLRRLLSETHPDKNPDRAAEVRPVFDFALKMMRRDSKRRV